MNTVKFAVWKKAASEPLSLQVISSFTFFDYLFLTCNSFINASFILNQNIEEIRRFKIGLEQSIGNIM